MTNCFSTHERVILVLISRVTKQRGEWTPKWYSSEHRNSSSLEYIHYSISYMTEQIHKWRQNNNLYTSFPILPACTTATAHTFAFEFDLVMDVMAILNNKQTELSTGEKTYDMTVYKVWKRAAWSKHAVKSWLYVEHPIGWMLFAWHFFNHHLDTDIRLSTTAMRWLGKTQQKTNLLSVSIHSTILYH